MKFQNYSHNSKMLILKSILILLVFHLQGCIEVLSQECSGGGQSEPKKPEPPAKHTNIVLLGATGDLAQRYLWPGLFSLFSKHYKKNKQHFTIYACARSKSDKARHKLSEILLEIKCESKGCKDLKKLFVESTQYHQLKIEDHYKGLAEKINENIQTMYGLQGTDFSSEEGRLIYLSIPPSSYAQTSMWVNKHLRPKLGHPWFRVVIEKPFGHDLSSAQKLVDSLMENFDDKEIYRIDHYLGKTIVKNILPFRNGNKDSYNAIWNRNHIERVEIVMKETLDVADRIAFYDDIGVILDMMQNHMTEVAALVAMELPKDADHIGQILAKKVEFLETVRGSGTGKTVTGQYRSYTTEVVNSLDRPDYISETPTFAASLITSDSPRWRGVPFVLVSGKKLDEKASYARVIFRDNRFCYSTTEACHSGYKGQIMFRISDPPMILVSKTLPAPHETTAWKVTDLKAEGELFGEKYSDMVALTPNFKEDAYTTLIEGVYEGQRHLFVDTKSLMSSWRLWDPIIRAAKKQTPRLYEGRTVDQDWLAFEVLGSEKLAFVQEDDFMQVEPKEGRYHHDVPSTFRGQKLVSGSAYSVIMQLADDIEAAAFQAIEERGTFHLALSGGRSPKELLGQLATESPLFPWQHTHIWLVDERCVPLTDSKSNFQLINRYLLQEVSNIPYLNIHPMPVHLASGVCDEKDDGAGQYSALLRRLVPGGGVLDYVVLGVGTDGHTASIFPNTTAASSADSLALVTLSDGAPTSVTATTRRMTLTLHTLSEAIRVSVLVTGAEKHEVVSALAEAGDVPQSLPITGVKADEVVWYIDLNAWRGQRHIG